MISIKKRTVVLLFSLVAFSAIAFAEECGVNYRQFRLEDISCDTAILYKANSTGLDVAVSVIAYGKASGPSNWKVTDISLNIDSLRIDPDAEGKFYVKKDRLSEYPAAVVFAAMDTQLEAMGLADKNPSSYKFADPGLGLLTDQAGSELLGENRLFALDWDAVDKICEGRDFIEVALKCPEVEDARIIKIYITKGPVKEARFDFDKLRQDELMQIMETLSGQIDKMENNRDKYKEGVDPEYAEMQGKIEDLEVERAIAYKTWFDRRQTAL